jgi:hypothetical protein
MITMFWTDAPAGGPGVARRSRRGVVGLPAEYRAVVGCPEVARRAPGAFTAPFQGIRLPFAGSLTGAVAPVPAQRNALDITHTDATTLGIHSARRPPS